MAHLAPHDLLAALRWRYSVKQFDPERKIPAEIWTSLEEALVLSPSSMGLQPWRFVVVQEAGLRKRLAEASWDQRQPLDCSHYVVFAARKGLDGTDVERHVLRTAEVRGVSRESLKGFEAMLHGGTGQGRESGILDTWMAHQVYIALGGFITAASVLGIDTCPMEGLEAPKYDEILALGASGHTTLCACAAGYRSSADKYARLAKVRFKVDEVVVHA
ncbi:MAG TPA: NAD(P)H-dependent oxidoreductase [Opitutaceae bacterium]|jgi:nitroreductase